MKTINIFAIACTVLSCFFPACDSKKGEQGPAGPALMGNIRGFAELHAENGSILASHGGASISTEGPVSDTTASSTDGKWILTDLTTGVYNITFSKSGFADNKVVNFQFAGGGEAYVGKTFLVQKPTYRPTTVSISASASEFYVSGNVSSPAYSIYGAPILLFMDTTNSVSSDPKQYLYFTSAHAPPTTTLFELRISAQQLRDIVPLARGTRIFLAAYAGAALFANSSYPDTATGRLVYTAISDSSRTGSFLMP